jgi:hypothetical protein
MAVTLGGVAVLLAVTGMYGAISFAVSLRTKELGIRMALGAQRRDIVAEVLRSGGRSVFSGLIGASGFPWRWPARWGGRHEACRSAPTREIRWYIWVLPWR